VSFKRQRKTTNKEKEKVTKKIIINEKHEDDKFNIEC
jgi:hypothetical protein